MYNRNQGNAMPKSENDIFCDDNLQRTDVAEKKDTKAKDTTRRKRRFREVVFLDDIFDDDFSIADKSEGCPGISFSKKNEIIQIYRTTITALHNPGAVCFLFHPDKKEVAIASCATNHRDGVRVPEFEDSWDGFRINSKPFLDMLWSFCNWKDDETYRVMGEKVPGYKTVRFPLENAEIVSMDQEKEDSFPVVG